MKTPSTEHTDAADDELAEFLETADGQQSTEALTENILDIARECAAINPKDLIGVKKVPLSLVPPVAEAHCALGLLDGKYKYGLYNWREYQVQAMIYLDAIKRHHGAIVDGEWVAPDSHVTHLGHIMACCAILLDAHANGVLVDDRPPKGSASRVYEELQETVEFLTEKARKRVLAAERDV